MNRAVSTSPPFRRASIPSLPPGLHDTDSAYKLYLRTARLDLDDYNREVKDGLHVTSMAGTWLSIVEGLEE